MFEQGSYRIKGWLAWAIIHVYLLVGFQHRLLVSTQWLWRYLIYELGARLIAKKCVETKGSVPTRDGRG